MSSQRVTLYSLLGYSVIQMPTNLTPHQARVSFWPWHFAEVLWTHCFKKRNGTTTVYHINNGLRIPDLIKYLEVWCLMWWLCHEQDWLSRTLTWDQGSEKQQGFWKFKNMSASLKCFTRHPCKPSHGQSNPWESRRDKSSTSRNLIK